MTTMSSTFPSPPYADKIQKCVFRVRAARRPPAAASTFNDVYVRRDGAVLCNFGGSEQNNDVHMVVAVAAGSMAGHGETG